MFYFDKFSHFFLFFKIKIFIFEVLFFFGAFLIGILSVLQIKATIFTSQEIANQLPNTAKNLSSDIIQIKSLNVLSFFSLEQFIIAFLFVTAFFLYLIKTKYGEKILKALFILAIFTGGEIFFRIWVGDVLAIVFSIVLIGARFALPKVIIHNIIMVIAITGVAINFGLGLDSFDAVMLLVIISVYDFWAVYVTGHMVKMFKSTVSVGMVFAMIVPDRFSNLLKNVEEVEKGREKISLDPSLQKRETEFAPNSFIYLGGGDLAFPLVLGISAAAQYGITSSIFILIGVVVGLLVLNMIFSAQKIKKPMPALPILAFFSILGFIASFIKF